MKSKTMLADRIKEQILKDYIYNKQFKVGMKLPTIRELAQQYGISTPTVGKMIESLSANGLVNKRMGSGIFLAKNNVCGGDSYIEPKYKIGYIVSNITLELGYHVMQGVERAVRNNGCVLEIANSAGQIKTEKEQVISMINRGVDGIVLYPTAKRDDGNKYLHNEFRDYPIVAVDLYEESMKRPHVVFDNYLAGREMTDYLIGQGRQRIGFVKFEDKYPSVDARFAGYLQAIRNAGLTYGSKYVGSCKTWNCASCTPFIECLQKMINNSESPDAIILPADNFTEVAMRWLTENGIKVPQDILITGFDNLSPDRIRHFWPTTNPDFIRLGELATEMLIRHIETREPVQAWDKEIMMPCPLMLPSISFFK